LDPADVPDDTERQVYGANESVPVTIDNSASGLIDVGDVLP
jgi:hypothetical protein